MCSEVPPSPPFVGRSLVSFFVFSVSGGQFSQVVGVVQAVGEAFARTPAEPIGVGVARRFIDAVGLGLAFAVAMPCRGLRGQQPLGDVVSIAPGLRRPRRRAVGRFGDALDEVLRRGDIVVIARRSAVVDFP